MERNRSHFWRATLPANKDSKLTVTLSVTLRRHFEMREKLSTFALAKEEEHRLFLFLRFWPQFPYMTAKTIIYERKNCLI